MRLFPLAAVALFGWAEACGGSSVSGSAQPIPEADFQARLAAAVCERFAACCATAGYVHGNLAGCEAGESFNKQPYQTYDAQAAGDCLQQTSQLLATCPPIAAFLTSTAVGACNKVYSAAQAPGQPCESDQDCAPGPSGEASVCVSDGSSPGVCRSIAHASAGAPCNMTYASGSVPEFTGTGAVGDSGICFTSDGLYCSPGNGCAKQGGLGDRCIGPQACAPGTRCDTTSGTCAPLGQPGAPCTGGLFGTTSDCVSSDVCDALTDTCFAPRAAGAACRDSYQCVSLNCDQGRCVASLANAQNCSDTFGAGSSNDGGLE